MFKKRIKKSAFLFQTVSQMFFSYQYEIFFLIFDFEIQFNTQKILHVETEIDNQIRFMINVVKKEKTFRIFCIIKINMLTISIYRNEIQTNQKSDFNIILMKIIKKFNFELFSLNSIDFKNFIMRIADYKKFLLLH